MNGLINMERRQNIYVSGRGNGKKIYMGRYGASAEVIQSEYQVLNTWTIGYRVH